jgi:hypothetical protein
MIRFAPHNPGSARPSPPRLLASSCLRWKKIKFRLSDRHFSFSCGPALRELPTRLSILEKSYAFRAAGRMIRPLV